MKLAEKCRTADKTKYCDVLLHHFAHIPHDVPEPLQRLAQLPFKSYVTTVFDPLLERALQSQPNSPSLTTYRYPSLPIEFEARHLFYIHGQIQVNSLQLDPAKIVLSTGDFRRAYNPHRTLLWGFLQQVWTYHSCCFVGCGLREPDFQKLFEVCTRIRKEAANMSAKGNPPEHFALFEAETKTPNLSLQPNQLLREQQEQEKKAQEYVNKLKRVGITVIWFKRAEQNEPRYAWLREFLLSCLSITPTVPRSFLPEIPE
jgi:hypothetical protein